ncbi:MAG TPA: hypothetical protein VN726_05420 [Hanamia sp.]|nr:hypothetical protein [Hanamia sp.]
MVDNSNEDFSKFQEKKKVYGDPEYSANEDIYNREKKLPFNEEVIPEKGKEKDSTDSLNEQLDVPGAELDDADEFIGEEDEENNYYSLGGDDHNDLDEDDKE